MGIFRKSTIFHVEESLPDPEELKLRFRRRVLIFSFLAFLFVLGAPVAKDLRQNLKARAQARRFAEQMLSARTLAAITRQPVSLELAANRQGWVRHQHASGETCQGATQGEAESFLTEGELWSLKAQQESGASATGHVLCWHPMKGLLLDSLPLGNGQLLVSLAPQIEGTQEKELAAVLVTMGGAEVQTISY